MRSIVLVLVASGFLGVELIQAQQPPPPPQSGSLAELFRDMKGVATQYSGSVTYRHQITGPGSVNTEQASVTILEGKAQCGGGYSGVEGAETTTLPIAGPGLFEIFFQGWEGVLADAEPPDAGIRDYTSRELRQYRDSLRRTIKPGHMAYSFWVACPNVLSVAAPEADYRHSFDSYKQDFDAGGGNLPDELKGSWSVPAPETDAPNNVGGVLEMSWDLCRCMPMHIMDLDGTATNEDTDTWRAIVEVTVLDKKAPFAPVAGAKVTGYVFGSMKEDPKLCITGADGRCKIAILGIPKSTISVTWSVANVEAPKRIYAPPNDDLDSDSDGTAITIAQP